MKTVAFLSTFVATATTIVSIVLFSNLVEIQVKQEQAETVLVCYNNDGEITYSETDWKECTLKRVLSAS